MTKFCPILTIGFAPPAKGEIDMRTCKKDCAWYNEDCETCAINLIVDYIKDASTNVADLSDIIIDYNGMGPYDDDF